MPEELLTGEDKERLKAEILANCELVADCWVYKTAINPSGYGMKKIGRKVYTVSRFMLAYDSRESLSVPYDACHQDDVCPYKSCCNPRHLYWATRSDNCKAREKRKREEREYFTLLGHPHAWIDGVFYEDHRDADIDHCLASLNRGKVEHATTELLEDESTANPFAFLANIYRQTVARMWGTINPT